MKITKSKVTTPEGIELNAAVEGRIDAPNAQRLLDDLSSDLKRVKALNIDFRHVDYISSVGIRSLLILFKQMRRQNGKLVITNINDEVKEVFKLIGLMEFIKTED